MQGVIEMSEDTCPSCGFKTKTKEDGLCGKCNSPKIDWVNQKNTPRDAVQYWGKCKNCGQNAFVDKRVHFCTQCVFKAKPNFPKSEEPVDEPIEADASPWNNDEPSVEQETVAKLTEGIPKVKTEADADAVLPVLEKLRQVTQVQIPSKGRAKKSRTTVITEKTTTDADMTIHETEYKIDTPKKSPRKKPVKGGFTPRTQVTKITPATFTGPVGAWHYDETRKAWVIKDDKGRVMSQSKEKPKEA